MSRLNIDQQTIMRLLSDPKADFLIPDYQRPYSWVAEKECQKLWDDIFAFSFPNDDYSNFNNDDEYFLGPIVTFKNEDSKKEIIDGQQRLTTIMLLLRVFYSRLEHMQDENSIKTRKIIAECIWKTDEFGNPDKNKLKIDSEVSSDDDKEEFLSILKHGVLKDYKSRYAKNYEFFDEKVKEFLQKFPSYFAYFPNRILKNCILLPIEAESQDTALRIFSTLNDRGKPLSDTDIFKAQFYKYYKNKNEKDIFIDRWKKIEDICDEIFVNQDGSSMDELFTRYMYYLRANKGIKDTTTKALRKFYEEDKYKYFRIDNTLDDLEKIAEFWENVYNLDDTYFDEAVLRELSILKYAPNGMWTYIVTVYYMNCVNSGKEIDQKEFYLFLHRIIAFIWLYAVMRPGVNALRTPLYQEMINIVNGKGLALVDYKYDKKIIFETLSNYEFTNQRPITKSILAWWVYQNDNQIILSKDANYEIEHIYSKKRQDSENGLKNDNNLESIGNKSLLEKSINIRASDYRFEDKKKYYNGFTAKNGKIKGGTKIQELIDLSSKEKDFGEKDIIERKEKIINAFIDYLDQNRFIK